MERLTNERKIGVFASLTDERLAQIGAFKDYDTFYAVSVATNKLFDYENIGTPQELAELKADNEQLKAKIEKTKQANEPSFERLRELNTITSFIPLDRLKEICDYERFVMRFRGVGNETSKN